MAMTDDEVLLWLSDEEREKLSVAEGHGPFDDMKHASTCIFTTMPRPR